MIERIAVVFVVSLLAAAVGCSDDTGSSDVDPRDDGPDVSDPLHEGLVLWVPIDGADVADFSGFGHRAELVEATPVADRHGNEGGAIRFDGEAASLVIEDHPAFDVLGGDMTVSLWLRHEGGGGVISHSSGLVPDGWWIHVSDSHAMWISVGDQDHENSSLFPTDGAWHHLAVVRTGTTVTFYLDGVAGDAIDLGALGQPTYQDIKIGLEGTAYADAFFEGALDDIRLYERSLSAEELAELTAQEYAVPVALAEPEPRSRAAMAIEWERCSWMTLGDQDNAGECATVFVPLDYDRPDGPTWPYFVKRRPSGQANAGQLWLLQGGPGFSGIGMEKLGRGLQEFLFPHLDIYLPDHRGTYRSARLSCLEQESGGSLWGGLIAPEEWPDCLASIRARQPLRLPHITTSNVARDIHTVSLATRGDGAPLYLLGISWGTWLVQRYLHLFPYDPTAVVMDSVVAAGTVHSDFDAGVNEAGRALMDTCAEHDDCSRRLGEDPWATTEAMLDGIEAGDCPEIDYDRQTMTRILGMVITDSYNVVTMAPAVVYRALRCNEADQAALIHLRELYLPDEPYTEGPSFYSPVHERHLSFPERWEQPAPSLEEILQREEDLVMSMGLSAAMADQYDGWPLAPAEMAYTAWPAIEMPMLLLHAEIDARTPISHGMAAEAHYTEPHHNVIILPHAGHGVLENSPTVGVSCGGQILDAFIDDPTAELEVDCAEDIIDMGFSPPVRSSQELFGTADRWGDE